MKLILGWLSDPFFHVACVVVVLFQLLHGGEAKDDGAEKSASCSMCKHVHDKMELCSQVSLSAASE